MLQSQHGGFPFAYSSDEEDPTDTGNTRARSEQDAYVSINDEIAAPSQLDIDTSTSRHSGVCVEVNNLSYGLRVKGRKRALAARVLLRDVRFVIKPSELTAIMGASGSGKTTLLDCIGGRKQDGLMTGSVQYNGSPLTQSMMKRCAYIQQHDEPPPTLTVHETLTFWAQLRMPRHTSPAERAARVNQIITLLGLQDCANTRAGDSMTRGISGGQAKRLSIGCHMTAMPDVFLLDEPSTGLDSSAALDVAKYLRQLTTKKNATVAITLHQPSPELFNMFDKVLILSAGRCIYYDSPLKCQEYFSSPRIGCVIGNLSPAEFVIGVAGGSSLVYEKDKRVFTSDELANIYTESQGQGQSYPGTPDRSQIDMSDTSPIGLSSMRSHPSKAKRPAFPSESSPDKASVVPKSVESLASLVTDMCMGAYDWVKMFVCDRLLSMERCEGGLWVQTRTLLLRAFVLMARDWDAIMASLIRNIFVAILSGVLFFQVGDVGVHETLIDPITGDPAANASNILSLFFFAVSYALVGSVQAAPALFESKVMFTRENASGLYSAASYWMVQLVCHLPVLLLTYTIYILIAFFMIAIPFEWGSFLYFYSVCLLGTILGYSSGQFFAAALKSAKIVFASWPMFVIVFSLFSGYAIRLPALGVAWRWLADVSYVRWLLQACVVNYFQGYDQGPELLRILGFDGGTKVLYILYICLWYICLSLATLYALMPRSSALRMVTKMELEDAEEAALSVDGTDGRLPGPHATSSASTPTNIRTLAAQSSPLPYPVIYSDDEDDDITKGISSPASNQQDLEAPLLADTNRHMSMIGEGVTVVFRDLTYSIDIAAHGNASDINGNGRYRKVDVLNGVSGVAVPSKVLCVMGPSGAGKTTLLNILAGKRFRGAGRLGGTVRAITSKGEGIRVSTAYVTQDCVTIPTLSVRETLEFAARLRVPSVTGKGKGASSTCRHDRVNWLLKLMGLWNVQNTLVGDTTKRGISGGELKRLSIAVEIIGLPEVIIIDEPTSGLDASTAAEIIKATKRLANTNRTVIYTIHQPAVEVFHMADRLLVVAEGRTVFFGPTSEAVNHFTNQTSRLLTTPPSTISSITTEIPSITSKNGQNNIVIDNVCYSNPADVVSLAASKLSSQPGASLKLAMLNRELPYWNEITDVGVQQSESNNGKGANLFGGEDTCARSTPAQCFILTQRHLLKVFRNKKFIATAILRNLFVSVFYGSIWFQLSPSRLYERFSLLFFALLFVTMGNQQAIPVLFENRLLFYRERSGNAYGTFAFWFSSHFGAVPLLVFNSALFSTVLYYMAGLNSAPDRFGYFLLVLTLTNIVALSLCEFLSSLCRTQQVAIGLFPGLLMFFMASTGFIVRIPSLPVYLRAWAPQMSFMRWALQGLILNEGEGNDALFPIPPGIPITPAQAFELFLEGYGFNGVGKWNAIPILIATYGVLRIMTYFALRFLNFERR